MTGAPVGLTIDNHGVISGFVGDGKPAKYDVTIRVKDTGQGASDSVTRPLTVVKEKTAQ
jgi:hypothetical protein